jgi:hypothetical protein
VKLLPSANLLFRLLAGVILALTLASAVVPAQAAKLNGKGVTTLANATPDEAFAAFAGQTVIMERPKDTKGYRRERVIAVEGRFVAYFAPNGSLLIWGKDSDKVIQAAWGVGGSQNLTTGPDNKTGPVLCINFATKAARIPCIVIRYMNDNLFDATAGNIFNLKAGGAVPAQLPRSPTKLDRIKAAIGQDK